jgi:hypothetical protein
MSETTAGMDMILIAEAEDPSGNIGETAPLVVHIKPDNPPKRRSSAPRPIRN